MTSQWYIGCVQGHKQFPDRVVLRFRLSERVSRHNLYRRLAELLDWSFLYEQTQDLYSHTGQPSLDPVVFFKLVLVGCLENIVSDRQLGVVPERIQVDNGSAFISKALDRWAYDQHVPLDFSRLGKPTDNPYIESFNGSFRDECLNVHWLLSLTDA
jgi:hypothetical protein